MRHPARPGCSTARSGELDCPAITDQCVPLSATCQRPERRSDDGQMIFEALPDIREPGADLGFRGAPLRNRTVDLLLTMYRFAVLQLQVDELTCENTSTRWHSQAPDEPTRAPFATQLPLTLILQMNRHMRSSIFSSMTRAVCVHGLSPRFTSQIVYGRHAVLCRAGRATRRRRSWQPALSRADASDGRLGRS